VESLFYEERRGGGKAPLLFSQDPFPWREGGGRVLKGKIFISIEKRSLRRKASPFSEGGRSQSRNARSARRGGRTFLPVSFSGFGFPIP